MRGVSTVAKKTVVGSRLLVDADAFRIKNGPAEHPNPESAIKNPKSDDQHGIAVGVEAVLLGNGIAVGTQDLIQAGKGPDQGNEGGLG